MEEYKRQLSQPLDVLNKQTASITERRLAAAKVAEWAKLRRRVVSELYIGLDDPDEQVRLSALEVVTELGPLADNSIPHLNWMVVNDPSAKVRARAVGALRVIYYPLRYSDAHFLEKKAVAALQQALKDKDKGVRLRAANALGSFGPAARPAIKALAEALMEKDAKGDSGDKQPLQLRVSCTAADSLGRIGRDARDAIPALAELARRSDDPDLQRDAVMALGYVGDQDQRVLPSLLAALKEPPVRAAAAMSLGRLGSNRAKEIVPALLQALDTSDLSDKEYADFVQSRAIESMLQMGPEAEMAVPRLEALLKDPKTRFQAHLAAEKALNQLRR